MSNEKCPVCGTINKGLNLDETQGVYECEKCKSIVVAKRTKTVKIPIFDMNDVEGIKKHFGIA